jgi:hypothetical protein
MKFQKVLASEASEITINEDFRTALIKYKILKKHISGIEKSQIKSRLAKEIDGECSICLEPFNLSISAVTTTCGHRFHPYCLIKALGTGPCISCPLCRRKAAELVPNGLDGDIIRFFAMVRVNANAVQRCHESMLRFLEARLASLHIRSGKDGRELLIAAITDDLARLRATMRFAALNGEGFRKILKKFDRRVGCGASPAAMADLRRLGFFLDTAVAGSGRCAALRGALLALLRSV